ncbi:hypothetical protein OXB_1696 [Bacillus sp. OxB-1]|nr:hypothetical protein OXB_1696 [Bacillus sp. OxB-1]
MDTIRTNFANGGCTWHPVLADGIVVILPEIRCMHFDWCQAGPQFAKGANGVPVWHQSGWAWGVFVSGMISI